jgi:hypothetical protein
MYWYVSRQKIEALLPQFGNRGFHWLKELSFTLKSPFAEAKASLSPDKGLFKSVVDVENGLKRSGLADFPENESKVFFSFRLKAHRAIEQGAYFIVGAKDRVALLLAGSPSNLIGAPVKETDLISPTVDPLGAVRRAFSDLSQEETKNVSQACSYVWAAIAEPMRQMWDSMPEVEGIAVFGGSFPAAASEFQQANFADIDLIVVASPIFVRQV